MECALTTVNNLSRDQQKVMLDQIIHLAEGECTVVKMRTPEVIERPAVVIQVPKIFQKQYKTRIIRARARETGRVVEKGNVGVYRLDVY